MSNETYEDTDVVLDADGNRGLASVRVMTSLVLLVPSVLLLTNGWQGGVLPGLEGLPRQLVGLLGTVLFGFGAYWSLRLLLTRRPCLSITDEGIVNRTLWFAPALIPWEEIVDIRPHGFPGYRRIDLRDPDAWAAKQPLSVRIWSRYTQLLGFGRVPVCLWTLEAGWRKVDDVLEAGAHHAELSSDRAALEVGLPPSSTEDG